MSRSIARARAGRDRTSLYQEITDKIIAELEAGRVPWVQPWGTAAAKASLTMPKHAATHRHYWGINVLILWGAVIERRFSTQNWLTFRQALGLGGNVRKGEHGTTVVCADHFVPDEERKRAERDGDEPSGIRFLKRFTVFNTDQCEGLPPEVVSAPSPVPERLMVPQAEALIAATGADFRIGGDRAFYSPNYDFIQVPRPEAYFEPINWHRTALHELGHWTGAAQRLDCDLSGSFGSKKYAQEELVAEITSAFVCASLGIVPTVRHSDYIGSWLEVLREDDRSIVRAASAASKAADYLLAFCPESNECVQGVESSNHLLVNVRLARLRDASCKRGRPRFEGGRCRRDGSPGTESVRRNPSRRHDDAQVRRPGSRRLRRLLYRQHSPQREHDVSPESRHPFHRMGCARARHPRESDFADAPNRSLVGL